MSIRWSWALFALAAGCSLDVHDDEDVACQLRDVPAQPSCDAGQYLILCSAPRSNPAPDVCSLPVGNDRGDLWCCK
jgi:hypothetical protein